MAEKSTLTNYDRGRLLLQAQDALSMHLVWMARGRSHINGQSMNLPNEFVKNDDLCPVGNWLRERLDPQFHASPLYERTCALHRDFHRVLEALFAQEPGRTHETERQAFTQTGDDLTDVLQEWIVLGRAAQAP